MGTGGGQGSTLHALSVRVGKAVSNLVRDFGLSMRVVPRISKLSVPEYRNVFRGDFMSYDTKSPVDAHIEADEDVADATLQWRESSQENSYLYGALNHGKAETK